MVWLTLAIAVVNIGVGFAVAMHLGYGPPSMAEAWRTLCGQAAPALAAPAPAASSPTSPASARPSVHEAEADPGPPPAESPPATDVAGDEPAEPVEETDLPQPSHPAVWNLDERYVETSVLKLNIAMLRSGVKVTEIDTRLRACKGEYDSQTIQQCLEDLKQDCETYLVEQSQAAEQFHQRLDELGALASMGEQIEMTNLEQAAQIETTLSNLHHMDFSDDLQAAGERLLAEIDKLRAARHKLRDSQEQAFLAIARQEGRLGHIEDQLKRDRLTQLFNRVGLEATLHQWWEEGRPSQQELCVALLDLDKFQSVNEKHGSQAGDRVLYHVAQYLLGAAGEGNLVARFAGQQFSIVTVNQGPRTVTKNLELIRQSVERMTFARGDNSLSLTVSVAITPIQPDDTPETLFGRVEDTLAKAKQAGHNRTFFHDGEAAQLIQSPNLGAEYRDILI